MAEMDRTSPPAEVRAPSLGRRSFVLPALLSFAIAIVFIVFLLSRFDIDLSATWHKVRGSEPGLLAAAVVLYYLTFPLRALRWRMLLDNVDAWSKRGGRRPSVARTSEVILISWFINSIAWFRLGDAYRAYMVSGEWKTSFSKTIGTVVAERIIDIGVMFALLMIAGIGLLHGETAGRAEQVLGGVAGLAAVVSIALLAMRLFGLRLARYLPERLRQAYQRFQEGALGSFRRMPLLVAISVAIWSLEAARLYLVIHALDLQLGLSLVLFAALAHSVLTTIPVTPGGLGFVELGLTGLLALSLPRADAASATLLDRSITYFSIVVVGGAVFAVRQGITLRQARAARRLAEKAPEPVSSTADVG